MATDNIKLIYFDAKGRAEISRLVLAAAGQRYEDIRLSRDHWAAEKPNTPFGQLPVLELDGRRYAQSQAIATYLAREFGLYGQTNEDGLAIDQVVQLSSDFSSTLSRTHRERDETKKAELMQQIKDVEVPKFLTWFEKLLRQTGTGYFVGSKISLADIVVFDQLSTLIQRGLVNTAAFPLVQDLINHVENNENIKVYLDSQKSTKL